MIGDCWVAMRRALKVSMGADTYHDFQPAWAFVFMRAVSAPWQGATRRIGDFPGSAESSSILPVLTFMGSNWLARLGITTVMIRTWHVEMMVVLRRPRDHWLKVSSPLFFSHPPSLEGLTRTMTSDLPVRLGSCVLSVLRGNIVHWYFC